MYRLEIMMRYGEDQPAKNVLYPRILNYSFSEDGFFNIAYEANGRIYHRGIAIKCIVAYTVSTREEESEELEEPCDDGADN